MTPYELLLSQQQVISQCGIGTLEHAKQSDAQLTARPRMRISQRESEYRMPTASNLLCGCGRFMRVKKNSVTVEELTEAGEPYKLWDADLFECLECGVEIISGFAQQPFAEHYQPTYAATKARLGQERIYPGRCREAASTPVAETER